MGIIAENVIRFNHIRSDIIDLAASINEEFGEVFAHASSDEGSEEDPTALVFLDIPSFSTFSKDQMVLFNSAMCEADGVNFLILPEEYIRITLSICNYWEQEKNPYSTDVVDLFH